MPHRLISLLAAAFVAGTIAAAMPQNAGPAAGSTPGGNSVAIAGLNAAAAATAPNAAPNAAQDAGQETDPAADPAANPTAGQASAPDTSSDPSIAAPGPDVSSDRAGDVREQQPAIEARIEILRGLDARSPDEEAEFSALQSALASIEKAGLQEASAARFETLVEAEPALRTELSEELARPVDESVPAAWADFSVAELEGLESQLRARRDADAEARASVLAEEETRANLRRSIPDQIARDRASIDGLRTQAAALAEAVLAPSLRDARQQRLDAEMLEVRTRISKSEAELRSYDARRELLRLRRAVAERRMATSDRRFTQVTAELTRRRSEAARQAQTDARAAEREAQEAQLHPALLAIARRNTELADRLTEATTRTAALDTDLDRRRDTSERAALDFERVIEQVRTSGLTTELGRQMRTIRDRLPRVRELRLKIAERDQSRIDLDNERVQLEDEQLNRLTENVELERIAASGMVPDDPAERDALIAEIAAKLNAQNEEYLDPLIESLEIDRDKTAELIRVDGKLLVLSTEFRNYIDERILWVGNMDRIGRSDVSSAAAWVLQVGAPTAWRDVGSGLLAVLGRSWFTIGAWALVLLLCAALMPSSRRLSRSCCEAARLPHIHGFRPTVIALGVTIFRTAVPTGTVFLVAWALGRVTDPLGLGVQLSIGLSRAAMLLAAAEFLRQGWRPRGLFESHFKWAPETGKLVRRHLRWMVPIALPLAVLVAPAVSEGEITIGVEGMAVGRFAFIVVMILAAMFSWRILSPKSGFVAGYLKKNPAGWVARLTNLWYPAMCLSPLVFAVTAAMGAMYTAVQLERRVLITLVIVVGAAVARAMLVRWLLVAQRRLWLEQARRKREAALAELARERGDDDVAENEIPLEEPGEIDVAAISQQTRSLVQAAVVMLTIVGVYITWTDVFPAFNRLDSVVLWSDGTLAPTGETEASGFDISDPVGYVNSSGSASGGDAASASPEAASSSGASAGTSVGPSGADASESPPTVVSLADLLLSIFLLVVTILLARNLPALLEIAVLSRLPITPGGRYATSTLVRYVIVIVGVVMAFNAINIGWSKVQFLAAAITVGLGFGLQEIFANFVSGLIILFERPVRVGDIVTVNGVSGTVSRIRMRATTITDFDRKELVIPNKAFVTGDIVNWSLTDSVLRIVIPVGVAYGSDTRLAAKLLLDVAARHSKVMDDPPPRALFRAFGASTLDFTLHCFITQPELRLVVANDLLLGVDDAFREAGIEIAFPQQDLHLRSMDAGVGAALAGPQAGSTPNPMPNAVSEAGSPPPGGAV
ncbi:MAG: mechanosensitive ion channel domain-containing protein [Phycisphaerales bacterium]